MTAAPVIDILLPYYSPLRRARAAIESVLSQTDEHWRLVVVDDAYPEEGLRDWLQELDDPRVEYIRNAENLGLSRNFSRCLDLVRADYFVMLGDDDLMHPGYVRSVVEHLSAHPDVDIVQPGVRVIDQEGRAVRPLADRIKAVLRPRGGSDGVVLSGERLAESLMRADWAYFPSLAWRTSAARSHGFREEYAVALDYGLLLDIALDGGSMLVYDDEVFSYRRHRASVSSATASSGLRFEQERKFALDFADRMAAQGWLRAARIGRHRVISRLHGAAETLSAVLAGDLRRARVLSRSILR